MDKEQPFMSPGMKLSFSKLSIVDSGGTTKAESGRKMEGKQSKIKRTYSKRKLDNKSVEVPDVEPAQFFICPLPSSRCAEFNNNKANTSCLRRQPTDCKMRLQPLVLPKPTISSELPSHDSDFMTSSSSQHKRSKFYDPKAALKRVKNRLIKTKSHDHIFMGGDDCQPPNVLNPVQLKPLQVTTRAVSDRASFTSESVCSEAQSQVDEIEFREQPICDNSVEYTYPHPEQIYPSTEKLKVLWKCPCKSPKAKNSKHLFEATRIPFPEFNKILRSYKKRKNHLVASFCKTNTTTNRRRRYDTQQKIKSSHHSQLRPPRTHKYSPNGVYKCVIVKKTFWMKKSLVHCNSTEITRIPRPDYSLLVNFKVRKIEMRGEEDY